MTEPFKFTNTGGSDGLSDFWQRMEAARRRRLAPFKGSDLEHWHVLSPEERAFFEALPKGGK
jgi:hypothetical protein